MISSGIKIVLLQPPITLKREDLKTFGVFPPLGLAYIAAVLIDDGFHVEIHDCLMEGIHHRHPSGGGRVVWGLPAEEIKQILHRTRPDVIGIANNFSSFNPDSMRLAQIAREALPAAVIVMGGAHASTAYGTVLESGTVDAVVLGEGEFTFRDMIRCIAQDRAQAARRIGGTVWRIGDTIIDNGPPKIISALDQIPFPAYHLLHMER